MWCCCYRSVEWSKGRGKVSKQFLCAPKFTLATSIIDLHQFICYCLIQNKLANSKMGAKQEPEQKQQKKPIKQPANGKRPQSPGSVSTITTLTDSRSGKTKTYTTKVEKSKPKYSFKIQTTSKVEEALPDEIEFDAKHFVTLPGILKILQLVSCRLCLCLLIFFSLLILKTNNY